jgi:phosphopantothenoylcysteine decarboxylase / phosphopantothenate---cysteine ligase
LVVNAVNEGRAFGRLDNAAVILSSDGSEVEVPFGPKTALAAALCDAIVSRLGS